jgi:hypothetical protein
VAREFAAAAHLRGVAEGVRFSNLYDAAHAAALAGLKLAGYRAPDGEGNRLDDNGFSALAVFGLEL